MAKIQKQWWRWRDVAGYLRAKARIYETLNDYYRARARELRALAADIDIEIARQP